MRLAVLTLRLNHNYGGVLQAYALSRVLSELGHRVTVPDMPGKYTLPCRKKWSIYPKRVAKKLLGRKTELFRERRLTREFNIVNAHFIRFIDDNIPRYEIADLRRLNKGDYDGIVVGSDQVWRPKYCRQGKIGLSFLDFASDWSIKRVAYAASFGTDTWEYTPRQTKRCAALLRKFDRVSVREDSAVSMCERYLQRADAVHVLDPTMLLDADIYRALIDLYPRKPKDSGLVSYILDERPQKKELTDRICRILQCTAAGTGKKDLGPEKPASERVYPAIEEWLGDLRDAAFVVTDSFHGCVFSILFGKPFLVYANRARGYARFSSLLSMLGLENRMVDEHTTEEALRRIIDADIDYERVNAILRDRREASLQFLKQALQP